MIQEIPLELKVLVHIHKGIVEQVFINKTPVTARIVDSDLDGADPEDIQHDEDLDLDFIEYWT